MLDNFTKPSNKTDNFVYFFQTSYNTPFFFPYLQFNPYQGIRVKDFKHIIINENNSIFIFNTTCRPDVSYTISINLVIFVHGCSNLVASWDKVCGKGIPGIFMDWLIEI